MTLTTHGSLSLGARPDTRAPDSWFDAAACVGRHDEFDVDEPGPRERMRLAAICRECPVWEWCARKEVETGNRSENGAAGFVAGVPVSVRLAAYRKAKRNGLDSEWIVRKFWREMLRMVRT